MTEANGDDTGRQELRDDRLPNGSPSAGLGFVSQQPHYLDLEEARQLLAEMNVHLTRRQIKLTVFSSLAIAEHPMSNDAPPGCWTPAWLMGENFILGLPGMS